MKLLFKPEDFSSGENSEECSAEIAQAKFDAWLESQKDVYSDYKENVVWGTGRVAGYKYRAKLVCIEEMPVK